MARYIERGESLFIPFRNGKSIADSQLRPRMYKSVQNFESTFPSHNHGTQNIELVEYVEVVRCSECEYAHFSKDSLTYRCKRRGYFAEIVKQDDFCSYGERRD